MHTHTRHKLMHTNSGTRAHTCTCMCIGAHVHAHADTACAGTQQISDRTGQSRGAGRGGERGDDPGEKALGRGSGSRDDGVGGGEEREGEWETSSMSQDE
jgi:hypothetical protein